MKWFENENIPTQRIAMQAFGLPGYQLSIKREDKLHKDISGNKFRKLKYNLLQAAKEQQHTLLTFGGAFSNHIAAVAAAGKRFGFKTIGIIRGEELARKPLNTTLQQAKAEGMQLHFISRSDYKRKENPEFTQELKNHFGTFFLIPEGGTNALAIKGASEILKPDDLRYEYICVPVGTGGTLAGVIKAAQPHQEVIGFSVLDGTFQEEVVKHYTSKTNWTITDAYNFGGYAKMTTNLINWMNGFSKHTGVLLDPVYTGKMMFGIVALMKSGYFSENSSILALHTGGLQGIAGANHLLKKKNLELIRTYV